MMNGSIVKTFEVIVIGGGPAGMIAAGRAAERGKTVLLLEKNSKLGKKLLLTGGGRCNLTNNKPEINTLVSSYKNTPKPLYSLFSQFGVEETLEFFHSRGMETKIEAEGRIFPISDKAGSVLDVLQNYIQTKNVQIKKDAPVIKITVDEKTKLIQVFTKDNIETAKSCIVAVGGTSHPGTGSTGDGFKWLKDLGHTIIENTFSLVPVALKDPWVKTMAGVTLQDIKLTIRQDGRIQEAKKGKLLFTHFGISGPTVLNMSSKIGDLLQYGDVILELDLHPELDFAQLKSELYNLLAVEINKKIKNSLDKLIPSSLVNIVLELSQIDPDKANHSITKEERIRLIKLIKAIPLNVKSLLGADKSIVSSGGIKIEEVNFKTMMSKVVPNLYIVGDMLNIDRPSGGYSLQLCWSTGYVAGNSVE